MAEEKLFTRVAPARGGPSPHPALLLLHGRGADEEDLLGLAVALDPRFDCVSARAPFAMPGGFGYCWYQTGGAPGQPEASSFARSLDLAGRLIAELAASHPLVVLCGFSQGAVMAAALAIRLPDSIAGAALLSGYLAVEPTGVAGRPFFVGHGLQDAMISVEAGRQANERLAASGAQVEFHTYPMGHQVSPAEMDDLNAWLGARLEPARS